MIALRKRGRKRSEDDENGGDKQGPSRKLQLTNPDQIRKPTTIRDKLLQREVMDLNPEVLPVTVRVYFPDVNILHQFSIRITPNEGLWRGGAYDFSVVVPDNYNMSPPKVKCLTPIWHPNITYPGGNVCLSLLRVAAADELGWTPTRHLKDIVLGLDALFGDLVNFEDPLNKEAADQYLKSRDKFIITVRNFMGRAQALSQVR